MQRLDREQQCSSISLVFKSRIQLWSSGVRSFQPVPTAEEEEEISVAGHNAAISSYFTVFFVFEGCYESHLEEEN